MVRKWLWEHKNNHTIMVLFYINIYCYIGLKTKYIILVYCKMKKCLWILSVYFDDEKEKLMFMKEYNNILEIKKEFNLGKSFLYECCSNNKYKSNSRKSKILDKYKRLKIEKKTFDRDGNFIKTTFNI